MWFDRSGLRQPGRKPRAHYCQVFFFSLFFFLCSSKPICSFFSHSHNRVDNIIKEGGTLLGCSNKSDPFRFAEKQPDGTKKEVSHERGDRQISSLLLFFNPLPSKFPWHTDRCLRSSDCELQKIGISWSCCDWRGRNHVLRFFSFFLFFFCS